MLDDLRRDIRAITDGETRRNDRARQELQDIAAGEAEMRRLYGHY